jgi:TonB family protein
MNPPLWFANFLAYCLQVALLVMAGTALPGLFRLKVPRVLLAYWQALLAVCLALPLLQPWKRAEEISPGLAGTATVTLGAVQAGPSAFHFSWFAGIAGVLAVGVAVRLVWLGVGVARLRRIRRAARRMEPPAYVREWQARLRVHPSFYLSPALDGPATVGLRPACVLLPERFPDLEESFQRAIACHEMLHVARRDWIFNVLEESILALFWFHPAVGWLVHRIRLSREQTVDALVVGLTRARKPYLRALLEIATGGMPPLLGAAPGFLKERQLAYRIELLVKEVRMSKLRLYSSLAGMLGLMLLAGGVAVWSFPLKSAAKPLSVAANHPAAPQASGAIDESDKPLGPDSHLKLQIIKKVNPTYPADAKKLGVEGVVVLKATIARDGSVTNLQVVSGPPELVKAALDAVMRWQYAPVEKSVTTEVKINFTLARDSAAPKPQPASAQPSPSPGNDKTVYKVGDGVTPPVPTYQPEPQYTKKAKADKIQGTVKLEVVVDDSTPPPKTASR